ncbi:uncharacterized protein LOC143236330 [Tachypleus tridentatus]|uniref:uncharacterized protein LOC143236330 n=1 Tax=Tachypleus tridentatus TaxID=6853 RepID=UPI003FD01D36
MASVDVGGGYGAGEAGKGNGGEFGAGKNNSGEYGIGGVNGDDIGAIEGVGDCGGFGVGGDNGDGYGVFGDNGDGLGTGGGNGSRYGSAVDNGNGFGDSQDHSSVLGTGGGQEHGTGTIGGNGGDETHGGGFESGGNSDFDEDCCVLFYLCKDGNVITDGSGIIDSRKKLVPSSEPLLDARLNPKSAFGCGAFHVCCKTPSTVTEKPYVHQCSFRNVNGLNKRILTAHGKGLAEFGKWPWQDDGGGPLMCWRKDGTYGLAGIVFWGIDCGQSDVLGVYVYIQNYLDWIFSVTGYPSHDYWPSH